MLGILFTAILFGGLSGIIWVLGSLGFFWSFCPEGTFAFVVTKGNETGDITKGGGNVVDIIHNIPGKILDRSGGTLDKWKFVEGEEERGLLFHLLGVIWIGYPRTLRTNKIRRFRRVKKESSKDYEMKSDDLITKFVPFSGEQAVAVNEAETEGLFGLDVIFNLIHEATYPFRYVIRVADANGILATMVEEQVIFVTGSDTIESFLKGGKDKKGLLVKAALKVRTQALKQIGITVTSVSLPKVDPEASKRTLFELKATKEKEGEAAVIEASSKAEAKMKINAADADRVERVYKPLAQAGEFAVRAREADAYEANETVTTSVRGMTPSVIVGGK